MPLVGFHNFWLNNVNLSPDKNYDKLMAQNSYQTVVQGENYYREFIRQNTDGIFRIDFDEPIRTNGDFQQLSGAFFRLGFIGEFNESFAEMNGFNETQNSKNLRLADLKDFFPLFAGSNVKEFFDSGFRIENFESEKTTSTGETEFFISSLTGIVENNRLVCVWGKQREITAERAARKTAEEVERNWHLTQKIEALGRLAGGIAHDFNNFLAVIMLQNDLLNLQLPANSPFRHRIEEMKKATSQAAAMVKQLLALGRKQPIHPQPTQINALIGEFAKSLKPFLSDKIKVEIKLETDAGVCFIDPNQTLQSLRNLVQNAADAMPDDGILTIETSHIILDKNSIHHKSQPEGSFVQITVSDTGIGMDTTTLESVFEPFFSTKKSAKGVGLGLATVYGFVKQSKGFIWVESEPDHGTTFKIQFPRIDQPV